MLISTLHAYFSGRKELFSGLAIEKLEKDWTRYPVFHLDLNLIQKGDDKALDSVLEDALCKWEEQYGTRQSETTFALRFSGVIQRARELTGQRAVILVDEYDKPILQTIDDEALQKRFRATLRNFYGVLKSEDKNICFAFLTGVTKFGKVSVFSDLNNLRDISMSEEYAGICGITDEELDTIFAPYVSRLADELEMPVSDVREELRRRYGGFHFCNNSIGVYNPSSLASTFMRNVFRNYWFETGTPSHLVCFLRQREYNLKEMDTVVVDESVLNSIVPQPANPIPVIYQSGYLTIVDNKPTSGLYTLGFPNKEVEDGFKKVLIPYFCHRN